MMINRALDLAQLAALNPGFVDPLAAPQSNGAALARVGALLTATALAMEAADHGPSLDWSAPAGLNMNFTDWLNCANCNGNANGPAAQAGQPLTAENKSNAQGHQGEWTAEDEQHLDQAVQVGASHGAGPAAGNTSGEFDKLAKDFGQTSEGNCASVAVIKAALDKYGTKVFSSVQKSGGGYAVQLQDGKSVNVTREELAQAAKAAKFKGKPNAAKSMAVLMYAVIAKQAAAQGHEGARDFQSALKTLANGENPKRVGKLLGLGNKMKDVSVSEAGQAQDGAVAWSGRHAVYTAKGTTDQYGKEAGFNGTDTRGRQLTGAFVFV